VPARAAHVVAIPAGDEAVLFDESNGHLRLLNPSCALVWHLCDGHASVATLAADIAHVLEAPYERVLPETIAAVTDLRSEGVLLDVPPSPTPPVPPPRVDARARLSGVVLIGPAGAVLVNDGDRVHALGSGQLAEVGYRVDDAPATIDRELETVFATGEPAASLRAILLLGAHPDHLKVASPARRLATLAPLLPADGPANAHDLVVLGHVADSCDVVRMLGFDTAELLAALEDLASPKG